MSQSDGLVCCQSRLWRGATWSVIGLQVLTRLKSGSVKLVFVAVTGVASGIAGCQVDQSPLVTPSASDVETYFEYDGSLAVSMSGNVAQVTVVIDQEEYRMGGRVWAMASPYIFLFSPATKEAFEDYSGLGGVRVIVQYEDSGILAQALLERSELNEVTWQRALNVVGQARTQGTESPGYMRDLIRWGEEHTDFQYNPEYIQLPSRRADQRTDEELEAAVQEELRRLQEEFGIPQTGY